MKGRSDKAKNKNKNDTLDVTSTKEYVTWNYTRYDISQCQFVLECRRYYIWHIKCSST